MSFFNNTNNNTSGGFGSGGGFGSTNTGGGFGSTANTSNAGSLFGGGTATSGGFGSGGFGANNANSAFGAKPAGGFGSTATTSGGSLFGGGGATSTTGGFGTGGSGFGSTNQANTGFGSGATGGGLFGQNKPATSGGFGSTNTTGGSMFGGGSTTGGFGSNTQNNNANPFANNTASTGFGATNTTTQPSTGFGSFGGSNAAATTNNGTGATQFQAFSEKDGATNQTSHYQSITFQQPYQNKSFEELRVEDYLQGRRYGNSNGQAGSFGQTTGFGGSMFGGNNTNNASAGGSVFGGGNTGTGNTGFSGFGANNANTNATGGFGSSNNTSGSLFGSQQNKPAGSLFGAAQSSGTTTGGFGSTAGSTGGLFGGGGGFGGQNNQPSNTGGGLFGANNQQQQNKPTGFGGGFGSTTTNTGGFGGGNNTAGGGLFGSNANNNTGAGGSLFGGQNNQQQPQGNPFGGSNNTGGGLFGNNNQNKPAGGLFGGNNTTTGTGTSLFGAQNNQQQSGGLFGANNNQQSGGLFGSSNQNKPAGGLFGNNTSNTNTSGGLFGNQQNNQQQPSGGGGLFGNTGGTSSLFGNNNQNKPAGGGLFGGNQNTSNPGGSLFGGALGGNNQSQQNNTGGGMFGSSLGQNNQGQQQGNSSLFGSSFGGNQQTPQQNQLHASLTLSPYGNDQLFASLGQSSAPVGPLATPLSGARPAPSKTPSLLSSTRLNSPIYTPRASSFNRTGTYGFSYSTYGTPGSAYSVSLTPQQSNLLKPTGSLGSALTSRLAKSMSMNNLRGGDSTPREGESLLRPTPGSSASKFLQSGNMRRLTIDRNLRADLFAAPENKRLEDVRNSSDTDSPGLRKKVSFDNTATEKQSTSAEPDANNALVRTEEPAEEESSPSFFRAGPTTRSQANGTSEMQQVNGNSLTTVPEENDQRPASAPATKKPAEKKIVKGVEIGDYWTKPPIRDLKNMSRSQLSNIGHFTVGREGVGRIEFSKVDLTNTSLDDICGKICVFELRSVTVYPEEKTKPARGKGLNVPSTIYLENSWPRSHGGRRAVLAKSGPAFEKHVSRLKSTSGTDFKSYDAESGVWCFTVQHFTTYGLEEDDEDEYVEDTDMQQDSSGLSEPQLEDDTMQSLETANGTTPDDTFEFKTTNRRSQSSLPGAHVPGGFDQANFASSIERPGTHEDIQDQTLMSGGLGDVEEDDPFMASGGAVQAPSPGAIERYSSSMALDDGDGAVEIAENMQDEPEPPMPGSFVAEEPKLLRSILKPSTAMSTFTSPDKLAADDWEEHLQRTMSPKKRDRQALKDLQQSLFQQSDEEIHDSPFKRSMLGQSVVGKSALGESNLGRKSAAKVAFDARTMENDRDDLGRSQAFRTSMDIMNSLWTQNKTTSKSGASTKGFKKPYPKKPRLSASAELNEDEAAFHDSMKPSFANDGTIVLSVPGSTRPVSAPLEPALQPLVGEHKEVRFARWTVAADLNTRTLGVQKDRTSIDNTGPFPRAKTASATDFSKLAESAGEVAVAELAIWKLCDVLFDSVEVACKGLCAGMSPEQIAKYEPRLRKDAFAMFWSELLASSVDEQIKFVKTAEERALLHLTKHDIAGACDVLVAAKDIKLATLIAQLPGSDHSGDMMLSQISAWRERNDWSEMSEPIRTLYSIAAGEVCTVEGKSGPTENRATSFCISERFDLNWMQSFGLRVFFGGHANLQEAVQAYCNDLHDGRERVQPLPWWSEEDAEVQHKREETLLSLLRLSVSRVELEDLLDAKTVSGSAINSRVAWQLATFLSAKGLADDLANEKLDRLTLDFAAELEVGNSFVTAAWVLLHLSDAGMRQKAVTELLFRNARYIDEPASDSASHANKERPWRLLTEDLMIPQHILWSAKAQHARAELDDACAQTKYLLQAGLLEDAHEVLCNAIGPRAVIEEDTDELSELLSSFGATTVDGWEAGGRVFQDYVSLVTMSRAKKESPAGKRTMERLRVGLRAMAEKVTSLDGRVAVVEMQRVLQEETRDLGMEDAGYRARIEGMSDGVGAFLRYREALGVVA